MFNNITEETGKGVDIQGKSFLEKIGHQKETSLLTNKPTSVPTFSYQKSVPLYKLQILETLIFSRDFPLYVFPFPSLCTINLSLHTESFPSVYMMQHCPLEKSNPLLTSYPPPTTISSYTLASSISSSAIHSSNHST